MAALKSILVIALVSYGGLVAVMYFAQRALQYFPERVRTPPAAAGLPQAEEVVLDTADGEKVVAWHVAPRGDKPVVVYFHGNGGSLRYRAGRFNELAQDGTGLVALSYRGYGGSTGSPTEAGLIADGIAAYQFAAARYGAGRIVLWGESLGGGVAVPIAAERPVARVILESPFTSAADVGASAYPFVPVRLLMKDQFRSDLRIAGVTAPVLVMHGEQDNIVPITQGERLYAMIRAPKRFVRLGAGGHNDLDDHGAMAAARAFIDGSSTLEEAR
jgi:fermentation-respiration switch protein FrsA (DUF1100 family)